MSFASEIADIARVSRAASSGRALARARDFIALTKPRVMSLALFTALVGFVLAPGHPDPLAASIAMLCIAAGAGAAGALNMWDDAGIDALMNRTAKRPIPRGRIAPGEALAFGLVLAALARGVLGGLVSLLAAGLLGFSIFFFTVFSTAW